MEHKLTVELPATEIVKIIGNHCAQMFGTASGLMGQTVHFDVQFDLTTFADGDKTGALLKGATVKVWPAPVAKPSAPKLVTTAEKPEAAKLPQEAPAEAPKEVAV